jgi:TetR/AcrR family transcriptional regulator, transcriptional repressor of aconitase
VARRRFDQLPPERKDKILRVAAAEFGRSGFHGTSYNQLLERLELGKSSAYYYFEDKRDLFLTAVTRCYATFFETVAKLERPVDVPSFWAFVERASILGYEFMLVDPTAADLMQCFQRERALLGELGSESLLRSMDGFYSAMIEEGQTLGAIRADLPAELLVAVVRDTTMTFDRWFVAARADGALWPTPADAARIFTDIVRRISGSH